jgi:hypothetical protein
MRLGETDSGSRDQVDPENPIDTPISSGKKAGFMPIPVASERFFQELIVHREKALPLPIASFAH